MGAFSGPSCVEDGDKAEDEEADGGASDGSNEAVVSWIAETWEYL